MDNLRGPLDSAVAEIVALRGRVLVRTTPATVRAGLHVLAEGVALPLKSCGAHPDIAGLAVALPIRECRETAYSIHLDALADWGLEGQTTAQVEVFDAAAVHEIPLVREVDLPAREAARLEARVAVHRLRATLVIEISAADGSGQTTRHQLRIDPSHTGGRDPAGYQEVSVDLGRDPDPRHLRLSILHSGALSGTPEGADGFLFLAGPRIATGAGTGGHAAPLMRRSGDVAEASWHVAELPDGLLGPGSTLALSDGHESRVIEPSCPTGVQLAEDQGHSVLLRARTAGPALVSVNGTEIAAPMLDVAPRAIRLPPELLTGMPSKLEVRDAAGMWRLFQTWILPPAILTPTDVLQSAAGPPLPPGLFAQTGHRFAAWRRHAETGGHPDAMAQLAHAVATLEAGYDRVRLRPLAFPEVSAPEVSVIVPAHNKVGVTYSCLCALLLAWNRTPFEVIVVDDGSTDETAQLEDIVSGIRVLHMTEPQRFIRACNAGAAEARGRFLCLLNNDTEPTTGWIDALVDAFSRFDKVGMTGAKLLYPDGRLQDAGGIVWGTGNPWNYGSRQNPADPRYCYARQADYLSGAALMIPRTVWDEVGGLSAYLEPMYFEDTDLAFKVREAGYRTWFVPSAVVYHAEGATSGTDTSSGFKRFQEVNRPKFKRRWARSFPGLGAEGVAPDLAKDRGIVGRVLFVDYTTPRPDTDAGGYAACQEMRLVQSLGYKVTFLPENLAHMGRYTEALQRDGIEVIIAPFALTCAEFLEARGAEFDAIYVTRYSVAAAVLPLLRRFAPAARVILNAADLHFLRLLRSAIAADNPGGLDEARAVREREIATMRGVDLVLSYSETEHAVIQSHSDGAVRVMRAPWVAALPETVPGFAERAGLSFLGSFRHPPNIEGLEWMLREVMTPLGEDRPDIALSIYGSGMTDDWKSRATPNVHPVGFVEDAATAYDGHRVFVAPLLSGAGIKGKVVTALTRGIPTILTPVAAEGLGLVPERDCLIATRPEDWRTAILRLHDDRDLWQKLAENSRALAAEAFSFERGRADMRAALEAVDLFAAID